MTSCWMAFACARIIRLELIRMSDFARFMDSSGSETSFTRDMALPIVDCLMLTMLALRSMAPHVTAYLR